MLDEKDQLDLRLNNLGENEHKYLVRVLEEKSEYYKERIFQYRKFLEEKKSRGDVLSEKQANRFLSMFEEMLEYNQKLIEKII